MSSDALVPGKRIDMIENQDSCQIFPGINRIVGQKQRATMAYRPQANGTAERMVQTLTNALKMYVGDVNNRIGVNTQNV